jgi:hypothetical protein
MGGWGSGPRDYKPNTDRAKRVDIRHLRRTRQLCPGTRSALYWTRGGQRSGSIGYAVSEDGCTLTLDYKSREQYMQYPVPLESIPCRYGGGRQYFRCPNRNCNRRCEVLYSCGAHFLCRKCCGYLYPSQKGDKLDKLREARWKAGVRIFEDWDGRSAGLKKKGMHQTTFDRGYARFLYLNTRWNLQYISLSEAPFAGR